MSSSVSNNKVAREATPIVVEPPTKKARFVKHTDGNQVTTEETVDASAMEVDNVSTGKKADGGLEGNGDAVTLDTNLYSRQIYALGESAMRHLRTASILISGIGSVGAEIAKNLILGGVRRVTIHDTRTTTWRDLSAQFYLREDDIGKNRAAASFQRLSELNDSVTCTLSTDPLTEKFVVILTDTPLQKQLEINKWTREADKRLLVADARGLFAYLFTDFGSNFRVDDASGEPCKEVLIEYVDRETGDVVCLDNAMHGFEDGDYVTFSEVKGMTELNGIDPIKITVKKSHVFNIDKAAANFSQYTEGGRAKQVKMPSYIKFKSLSESLTDPDLLIWDFAKFDNPQQLHLLWQALYKFEEEYGRSPAPRSDSDVELMKEVLKSLDKSGNVSIAPTLIKQFSYQASGNLVPLSSIVGGIGAQEAMKAITHHMTPLKQLLYIDCIEALPGHWSLFDNDKLTPEDCKQENSRYGGQIAVFGKAYQEALANQKFFIVGAGAIGCEILKNLAMMGIACGNGKLKITDMDQIEISNLNRQFLFRRKDVGSRKSEVAAKAVKGFNPKLNIVALAERVGPETEGIFNDSFFSELNGILNALDNLDARRYMDRRCIYYRLPLLESGTMGSKGNVQVVYPYLTESYGSSVDPPEKDIPICTLKNFPNEIQHTIQWARDLFEGMFTVPAETVNQFLDDERAFLGRLDSMNMGQKIQLLGQIKRSLIDDKPNSAEDCIIWARKLFQENYHDTIAQLLYTFPPNQVTDMGAKFWSGTKRCPHVLNFNPEMEEHFNFVYAGSILKAQQYNIQPILDKNRILLILNEFQPATFKPKKGLKIAVSDAEAKEQAEMHDEDADEQLANLKLKLAKLNTKSVQRLVPIDFEKDDDTNHHMEFITAASNLRAENYDIPPADRLKTKQIAGRIIPAIATTTAAIAGLVMIELYKMIGDGVSLPQVPIERFKNGFMNLSLPLFAFSEPVAAAKKKYSDKTFTLWDRIEIQGPKTLKELMDYIQEKTKLDISMLSSGVSLIYSFFMNASKRASRLNQDVKKVVEEVSRRPIPDYARSIVLEVMTTNENDEDVEIPYIKYNF